MREDFSAEISAEMTWHGVMADGEAVEDQHKYCGRIQNGYKMCTQRSR